ncbi:YqcC family protein [Psychromonas hadalis]|uniref:YqcC family protein n=1 Tax=Psychromonas hadalis TaxID=211669 RepID=UPI0003B58A8C|nr:YqcC family protein [Psychromonas hadalis]
MQLFEIKKRQLLAVLLTELEAQLRLLKCWQSTRPSERSLASIEPFSIDTLCFTQWLQFIFIEKMTQLLQLNLPLPTAMEIAPMASEFFKMQKVNSGEILALIIRIDCVINEKN